jgi:hypothetical protein
LKGYNRVLLYQEWKFQVSIKVIETIRAIFR